MIFFYFTFEGKGHERTENFDRDFDENRLLFLIEKIKLTILATKQKCKLKFDVAMIVLSQSAEQCVGIWKK